LPSAMDMNPNVPTEARMIHGSGIPFYSKSTLYADKLLSMHQDTYRFFSLDGCNHQKSPGSHPDT
jgi:hypothetical protein